MADMTLAKFFARIGLDVDTQKAEQFNQQLKNILITLTGVTLSATGFVLAIKKFTDETIESAMALKQFSAETGANIEKLQRWQAVADQTNDSARAVAESIKAITSNQEKIRLGQGNISGYQLLGIDPRQDPFEILEQLREKTTGLNQAMKKNVLGQIGVSNELIQVLELTNEEFSKMASQAFVISPAAVETIDKIRKSTREVGQAINWLKAQIVIGLAPSIEKLKKRTIEWIRINKEGVVKVIQKVFFWVTKAASVIVNASSMMNRIITSTLGWENALKGLLFILTLLNIKLLASPIGLFVSAIVLLLLVLDDLYVYSTGKGKSLFGNLMKKYPEFEKKLKNSFKVFKDFLKVLGLMDADKFEIGKILEQWGIWGDILNGIVKSLEFITNTLFGDKSILEEKVVESKFGRKITDFLSGFFKSGVQLAPDVEERIQLRKEVERVFERTTLEKQAINTSNTSNSNTVNNNDNKITNRITNNFTIQENQTDLIDSIEDALQKSIISASSQRIRNE